MTEMHTPWDMASDSIPAVQEKPSPAVQSWLESRGSLTEHIRQALPEAKIRVRLISLQRVLLTAEQTRFMNLPRLRHMALQREIVLYADERAMVYAQTLMPMTSLTGEHRRLRILGDKVLGDYLFKHRTSERVLLQPIPTCLAQRQKINLALVQAGQRVQTEQSGPKVLKGMKSGNNKNFGVSPVFSRQSRFLLSQSPILLTESFLPDLNAVIEYGQYSLSKTL